MDKKLIAEIKKKREFSRLPDSIIEKVAKIMKGNIKGSRALLRKYFGVFLTNKVLRGKGDLLKTHISSRERDYSYFYSKIFENIYNVGSVVDLGSGVNGFSYDYLRGVLQEVDYLAIEAVGQEVDYMNNYFKENSFNARAVCLDLFNIDDVVSLLRKQEKSRVVFLFQVIDALENLERNFSKKFILKISEECENIVLSLSMKSLSGRKMFAVQRKWLLDFLNDNFVVEKDFKMNGERVFVFHK